MINKLFLDLNNFKPNLGSVERGDSIELNIKLLNDEDYSRSKFRLLGAKSDGKSVEQIEGLNLEEKDLKVILEDQFVNCEGIVKLELNVVSCETEITTKEFYFFVSNTMNAEIINSADSIPTLEKVSKYVDDAVNNLDALKEASEDITIINSEFKENEIKRKANEMLREKNEKARLQSEDIRITEEEEREANELERIKAENNRKVSESNRKVSENTRVTNERAREEAELSRQSIFEENEEIRNSNENLRIASEKERIKLNNKAKTDEVNRKEAETKRVEAEKTRVIAEDERKKAETSRQEAEDIRQNTYTNFNEAEEERRNNEISRQEAEALRTEAEKRRDDLYSQKEEERNAAFLESERTRGTAFNEAQNDRNLTFEESERVREEAFKVSEAARNEAEEGRVAAELLRAEAEKLRVTGEENRNATFTQSEEERKATFEEAENARKVAESKRVKAETSRVEAEKLRVAAETGRVEAENLRVTAEEERVAAETKREEGFNKFEGKINANTEELKNARSATTGEKFNSLDERIDCEVDRLNKNIEVSFLQQEDKENHVIENTVEGMTTNMIIKGKTLYKKSDGSYTDILEENVTLESFGQQEKKISILSHGKNLFDYSKLTGGEIVTFNNKECFKFIDNASNFSLPINGELNKQYTISIKMYRDTENIDKRLNLKFLYSDGTSKVFNLDNGVLANYTTEVGKTLTKITGAFNHNRDCYIDLECTQLEEGTKSTEFEPYKCDKKDILLPFECGLNGTEKAQDLLISNAKKAEQWFKKIILNFDNCSSFSTSGQNVNVFYFSDVAIDKKFYDYTAEGQKSIICSNIKTGLDFEDWDRIESEYSLANASGGTFWIFVPKSITSKEWLQDKQFEVWYQLKQAIEHDLSIYTEINLKTFGEKTYVSFENSISGTSGFKAPVDAAATISRLNRENRVLEEENKNLRQDFESTTLTLTDSDLDLVKQNVDIDFRLMEVEFALDIPQAILSSKFKNKKGEVKSMARTPYEMMKIVILSGDYDREDYMHKVGKYYERGRMTKEEHDELMSLMTADEVISK
ncbi:TPA: hypothetical protein K8M96_001540 [Clostridium perfringens]|nr:hypothetical protein [Clostridium perfringens]HBI6969242.1 hypothetical protein [Clostridium perfringens]HBI6972284.1 hypothetical protein [Clostridium perfringens]HBI6985755.1 hypothetical protein [Clostridium perfringens]HBI7003765.1 hypothetical protein [Clostridium perfringens]